MAIKKKIDVAQEIINRILSQPVPSEGQLKHPIEPKHRVKKQGGQMTLSDLVEKKATTTPDDVRQWTTRTFVDYFAKRFQEETGGNYRRIYKADCQVFGQMGKFLASNGLERGEWTKRLIDWGFERRENIAARTGHFTPQGILRLINHFYQEEILPKVEIGEVERFATSDESLLEEIQQADSEGRATEILARYGLPVTLTYFVYVKKLRKEVALAGVGQRLVAMSKGTPQDREQLERIIHASVIGSPYPKEFLLRDWRTQFPDVAGVFAKETWWRSADYKGKYLPKYASLIQSGITEPGK